MSALGYLMNAALFVVAVMLYRRGEYGPALFFGAGFFFFVLFAR